MRDVYKSMFKRGFLPNDVAKQDPELLLDAISEQVSEDDFAEIPKGMEFFYGL